MKYHGECILADVLAYIDVTRLPGQLQELIDIMGLEEAYMFTQSFGGQCKYIPKSPKHHAAYCSEVAMGQGEIVNILLKIKNSFLPTKQILIGL
ncbi:hypothetical protein P5G63_06900 [Aeromonas salmonicida]|uniref:hypothetical protein n=1 Tax=Aeromonas salmonicida TaxID=645 RepID=UPI002240CACF|nr:hypothetical protein [Aeromonas salmonicida]MDF8328239.1 hypothetical protein [Aeromonas salmonicida]